VICATEGWLKDASETLEYGKAHDRYWNGELFVKQVSTFKFDQKRKLSIGNVQTYERRVLY
jgi:hypothetical protein